MPACPTYAPTTSHRIRPDRSDKLQQNRMRKMDLLEQMRKIMNPTE
jgi:hypothetical protein